MPLNFKGCRATKASRTLVWLVLSIVVTLTAAVTLPIHAFAADGEVISHQKISDTEGGFAGTLVNDDSFGSSIAYLGDLNDDLVGDLVVGARGRENSATVPGAVWILFLNSNGTVNSEQKITSGTGGFTGVLTNGDHFGDAVAPLGDLDNDGVTDIAVGAGDDHDGGLDRGAVWILFLNSNGTVKSHQKISDTEGGFVGALDDFDEFGSELATLGDLDGDGIVDLAVGAAGDDDGAGNGGALWILFLNIDGTVKSHQKISATEGGFTGSISAADGFGESIANLGDIDCDITVDIAVGAPDDDDGASGAGAVWILFLNSDGTVKSHQKISSTEGGFTGTLDNTDCFGTSVTSIGDVDGDYTPDIAVGARLDDDGGPSRGAVWILFLNANGTVKTHQKISDTQGNFTGILDDTDLFGFAVAPLGDFDGDGIGDLAVGSLLDDDGGTNRGAAWLLFLDGTAPSPLDPWRDVSLPPLADPGFGEGVVWADFDNDGDIDLYLSNTGANKMFRNDTPQSSGVLCDAIFTDVTSGPLGDSGNGRSAIAGDYDNDGDLDLYIVNETTGPGGSNKLLRNDGGFSFVNVTSGPLGGNGRPASWVDYDLDGDLDIYVGDDATSRLLRNDGGGTFVSVSGAPLGFGSSTSWGDYDNDGDPDLYLGLTGLFRNDTYYFSHVFSPVLGDGSKAAEWGDYDNDGDLDLYFVDDWDPNRLVRNDGGGTFSDATNGPLGHDSNDKDGSWADYDNDGDLDIVMVDNSGPEHLFRNDGGGVFVDDTPSPFPCDGINFSVAWGDYDGDGDLDAYFQNQLESKLLQNNTTDGNHWLHINLEGTASNRSAVGTRVRIVVGGIAQIREVTAGSGGFSQNSLTVEFGLGSATTIDTLSINWPSGLMEQWLFGPVPIDTLLNITEGDLVTAIGDEGHVPTAYFLHPNVPNPFNPGTTIVYELPARAVVFLRIYDVNGRLVRTLEGGVVRERGVHRLKWDGRNDLGGAVASGVYFYKLATPEFHKSRRMVLIR